MPTTEQIEAQLDAVRPLVTGDGADLSLVTVDAGNVTLLLSVQETHCLECVMPKELLSSLILADLQSKLPDVTDVILIDPRED